MTEDFKIEREKWGASVGHFILAFGDIENVTYLALREFPKDNIFESTAKLGFGNRVDLVIEIIASHPEVSTELRDHFVALLNNAKKLSEKRNSIAHSPLMMKVYEHPTEGWTHHEVGLANARRVENSISYDTLCGLAKEAETLAIELYDLYGKVHKHLAKNA